MEGFGVVFVLTVETLEEEIRNVKWSELSVLVPIWLGFCCGFS